MSVAGQRRYKVGMTEKLAGAPADWQVEGTMAHAERAAIVAALIYCNGDVSAAARRLRIGRSTTYRLAQRYEIPTGRGEQGRGSYAAPPDRPTVALIHGEYVIVKPKQ